MGENPLCNNPFFISQILCASKVDTLQKFSATAMFAGARPLIMRIMAVIAPLEEQQKAAKSIADQMKQCNSDTVQEAYHRLTHVLRERLMKNVEILEGYHPNLKPLKVMQWDENQLLDYLRYVERELYSMNVSNPVMPHTPSVQEPVRIKAFEIGANEGEIAVLEEQQKAVKFITDYMKQWKLDTVLKVHHHMTFSYKDDVLRKRLMKNVEILEGFLANPMPLQVMKWDENQLLYYLRYVERELSPMNVFNLVMPHKPSVSEPARINAFEIGANSGVPGPSIIHLQSSDGRKIAVELAVALKSNLIGNYLVDVKSCRAFDSCSSIKLPNVDYTTLEMGIDFCKQHVAVERAICVRGPKFSARVEDDLSSIAAKILNVNPETLADIISATDYMQMPVLLDFAIQEFAHLIEDSSPEQLCQLLDVTYFCDVEEKDPVDWEDMAPVDMENIIRKLKQQTSDQRFC